MLEENAEISMVDPYPLTQPSADPRLIEGMIARINAAKKPVLLVGSGTQYSGAWQELIDFSEKFQLPVLTSFKRQDAFPNNHPNYVGNLVTANARTRALVANESDLLIVIGSRLNQQTTSNFSLPHRGQSVIQVDADENNIGQNSRPEVGIVSDAKSALMLALQHPGPRPTENRGSWIAEHHSAQKHYSTPSERPTRRVSMERVMADLKAAMPANAITTNDAGSFGQWPQRYIEFDYPNSYIAPTLGCMGPGIPSAIAAKLAHPERQVIAHVGDGGFLMTGQEIATTKQFGVNIITIVYNNEGYNTIRMTQEAQYPGRQYGTDLVNPDFAELATVYGAMGLKVQQDEEFLPAFKKAIAADQPALIEVMTDFHYVSPSSTLSEIAGKRLSGE
jgi:acetolactate synthase-1/2/3 large subunit